MGLQISILVRFRFRFRSGSGSGSGPGPVPVVLVPFRSGSGPVEKKLFRPGPILDEAAIVEMLLYYGAVMILKFSVSQNKSFIYTEEVYLDNLYSLAHTGMLHTPKSSPSGEF